MILSSGCIFNYNNCKGCNSCQYLLPPIKFQTENFLPHSLEVGKACSKFSSPPALYLMACATLSRLLMLSPSTEMFPSLFGRVRDKLLSLKIVVPGMLITKSTLITLVSIIFMSVSPMTSEFLSYIHTHTHTHTHPLKHRAFFLADGRRCQRFKV